MIEFMSFFWTWLGLLLLLFAPVMVHAGGDEVVVIYNSRMPESKAVAEHYAAARQVPAKQIFGFALTTNEVMTRADFTDFLQQPLAEKLEATKLWKFGKVTFPATNGQPARVENRVVKSKIRYAVLCYGVPLKIEPSSKLEEMAEKITRAEFRRNEAAVDSELAWLPILKLDVMLTGPLPNPFYLTTNRASLNVTNGILLVARLDGPTPEIASALVDKALEAESNGFWGRAYFDARGLENTNSYFQGDQWILTGAEICRQLGFDCETDTNGDTLPASLPMSHIAIYAGWYANDACGPFLQSKMEFMPGAFAYHLHSYSADTLRSTTRNWCGPLLAKGATCTMGCVYEPFLQFTPNIASFLQSIGNGWTFGEAAWASQVALSWQTTVIGDPLYQPFKKSPPELHAELARNHNPLIEWSFNRLVNLDLVRGLRATELTKFLEGVPTTTQSAVLTEKLANLYESLGKPSSAIDAWQQALTLNPSPQQRIRLRRVLAEKLLAQNREADAAENWRQLIAEALDYADIPHVRDQLKELEQKLAAEKH
ncbi:MAG TPA: hypothetical protein DCQ92_07490 [Verrucomicrobia subdivision 3 bacterium]|nr:hypothetical protein [Limisphaerales bacterium]